MRRAPGEEHSHQLSAEKRERGDAHFTAKFIRDAYDADVGDVLVANAELRGELERLQQVQRSESERLLELLASSLGTLGFVKDTL